MKKLLYSIIAILSIATFAFGATTVFNVFQGGTGDSSFSPYPLVGNGTSALSGSSTPVVVSINATGTVATSTFRGALSVDKALKLLQDLNCGTLTTDANGFIQCGAAASGITSLNGLSGSSQTFTTANGLLSIESSGTAHNFNGSTTPTFGWLNATSTTASSTFYGGLVASRSLYITDNGVVSGNLNVTGTTTLSGLSVGFGTFSGNIVGTQSLNITATSTLAGVSASYGTFSQNIHTTKGAFIDDGLTVLGAISLPNTSIANAALQGSGALTISASGGLTTSGCGPVSLGGTCTITGVAYPFVGDTSTQNSTTSVIKTGGLIATASSTFAGFFNNGVATSSGNFTVINGQLTNKRASTTIATTLTPNWNNGTTQFILINAATVLDVNATSSNPKDGGKYILQICENETGGFGVSWGSANTLKWTGTGGQAGATTTITTTANQCQDVGMWYDGRINRYNVVASTSAYARY